MTEIMQVAFASDNNYAQHMAVSIASLLVNAVQPGLLCINILHDGLAEEHCNKITPLAALRPDTTIRFIRVSAHDLREYPLHTKLHPVAAYYRLKLPELLPEVTKVLYLDSDIIVKGDIADLWVDDLGSLMLKAVEEPRSLNAERLTSFGMKAESPYFNSGVLSLNLALMRAEDFNTRAAQLVGKYAPALRYQDQDVLNALAEGRWAPLPLPYNSFFYVFIGIYQRDFMLYKEADIEQARRTPYIIHYNQHPKPWAEGCIDPRRGEYFHYIDMTPYKGFRVNSFKSLWPAMLERCRAAAVALSVGSPRLYLVLRSLKRGIKACSLSRKP